MIGISKNGTDWYEVSEEQFAEMLADLHTDCWVDISADGGRPLHVTLDALRNWRECEGPLPGEKWQMKPTSLYGIPIIYE